MIWLQPVMVWWHLRNFGLHCPMRIASAHVATTGQLCRQNFVFRQNLEATRLKARQDKRAEKANERNFEIVPCALHNKNVILRSFMRKQILFTKQALKFLNGLSDDVRSEF